MMMYSSSTTSQLQPHPDLTNVSNLLSYLESRGFVINIPIDVDDIASKLGIDVEYDFVAAGKDFVGKIEFALNRPLITINTVENSYEPRRRFTIAHEIGHYCLHFNQHKRFVDTRKNMSRSGSYWDTFEFEANNFAAELLMPQNYIEQVGNEIIDGYIAATNAKQIPFNIFIDSMASRFKVSNPAMEYRLKNLGILS